MGGEATISRFDWAATFRPSAAERRILTNAAAGAPTIFEADDKPEIRARFLQILLLGLRRDWPVAPTGVRVRYAAISGTLDLTNGRGPDGAPLPEFQFVACDFDNAPDFSRASCQLVVLNGSTLPGLMASDMEVDGGIVLDGVAITGRASFAGAKTGGQFSANDATFENPDGDALVAQGMTVDGDIFLRRAAITGSASFAGAKTGGQFGANDATFENPGGDALFAQGMTADGHISLTGATITGRASFADAKTGGQFNANGATFENPGGDALFAHGMMADGGIFLDSAAVTGSASFSGAKTGGQFNARDATFENPGGDALVAEGMTADGGIFLDGATITGSASFSGAETGGQFSANDATFENPGGDALFAQGLMADGDIFLTRAAITGSASFAGAKTGGQFSAVGATFENPGGDALVAQGMTADGGIFLTGATFTGRASFLGAETGGQFSANDATFENPGGDALFAQGLMADGDIFLTRAAITGSASFSGAKTGGQFNARDATLENPGGDALLAQQLEAGTLFLTDARVSGCLHLWGAKVGHIELGGATLRGLDKAGDAHHGIAVLLRNAEVASDIRLGVSGKNDERHEIRGCLVLDHTRIGGRLDLTGTVFKRLGRAGTETAGNAPENICLSMQHTRIEGAMVTEGFGVSPDGLFDLRGAHADTLIDHPLEGWPNGEGLMDLDGFTYRSIRLHNERGKAPGFGHPANVAWRAATSWWQDRQLHALYRRLLWGGAETRQQRQDVERELELRRLRRGSDLRGGGRLAEGRIAWLAHQYPGAVPNHTHFKPQPYDQLAAVLREQGFDHAARQITVAKHVFQRRSKVNRWFNRFLSHILQWTSDYGYSPAKALTWVVAWLVVGWIATSLGMGSGLFEPASTAIATPSHQNALIYALDVAVPVIDLGQASAYRIDPAQDAYGLLEFLRAAYGVLGLILVSIAVLTFTGLMRDE